MTSVLAWPEHLLGRHSMETPRRPNPVFRLVVYSEDYQRRYDFVRTCGGIVNSSLNSEDHSVICSGCSWEVQLCRWSLVTLEFGRPLGDLL